MLTDAWGNVLFRIYFIIFKNTSVVGNIESQNVKGSVQRKLRWVENGVNRSVGASDSGTGHSFVVLFRFCLGFAIFPFLASTA